MSKGKIRKRTKTTEDIAAAAARVGEVAQAPFALPNHAGIDGPFPIEIDLPTVKGYERATFWVDRVWDAELGRMMVEAGVSESFNPDKEDVVAQHRWIAVNVLNKKKAWENFVRMNGTEWKYIAPKEEDIGSDKDPRIQLIPVGCFMQFIIGKLIEMATSLVEAIEGNSGSSSDNPEGDPHGEQTPQESVENSLQPENTKK
jgi:hypothetical protein